MEYSDGFTEMGAISLNVTDADRIIVGVSEQSRDKVALALGNGEENKYYMMECPPSRARQIAASLLNKADSVEGVT